MVGDYSCCRRIMAPQYICNCLRFISKVMSGLDVVVC